jgi:hypothetical protein
MPVAQGKSGRMPREAIPQPDPSRDREGAEVERVEQLLPCGRGSDRKAVTG